MKLAKHHWLIILAVFSAVLCAIVILKQSESRTLPIATVTISGAAENTFIAEVAEKNKDLQKGLMFRKHLAENAGMLFIFPNEKTHNFWMSNTYISLDILFINSAGKIVKIKEHATPLSEELISPGQPVNKVLEINAGRVKALNIKVGDVITIKK